MGKRKAGFRKGGSKNKVTKTHSGEIVDNRKPYEDIVRENDAFVKYYKHIKICNDDDWDNFLKFMKSDLPTTFRITGSKCEAKKMVDIVRGEYLQELLTKNEALKTTIFPLPWYPNNLAWQMDITKKEIRREEAFYKLHNFLISETMNGSISRQETVSMIPPIVLDVQSHHKVLDMCAAPGSKTAQLLEFLHADDTAVPAGYVIANDVDNKRCYMLVHQAKRLNSPCLAVINHDSAVLPNLSETVDGVVEQVQFDRILCDVPCSGDGTLRKNPDIWSKWTHANAINLHGIQNRILRRGCELLKVGGRIVYSTCSLNPIENEAVIHRILAETDGALELVDVSAQLPGLKYSPGMEYWPVGSRNLEFYDSFEEVDAKWSTTLRPQMFPPKTDEEKRKFNLNRCIRILPHQQNTGAFFVAVLQKLKPLSSKEKSFKIVPQEEEKKEEFDPRLPQNQRRRRRQDGFKEDPFVFFAENEPVYNEIKEFYAVNDDFDSKCLLVRCHGGKKKNVYFTSPAIRDLIVTNQGTIRFINSGVKLFVRTDNKNMKRCQFRIAQDGLESIFPNIGERRKIKIPREDLLTLLFNDAPEKSPKIEELSAAIQEQCKDFDAGSCVLIFTENDENDGDNEKLVLHLSGWRGTQSLRVYIAQCGTVHLLRLLGEDVSKYDKNKFQKIKEDKEGTGGENDDASNDAEEEKPANETKVLNNPIQVE